MSLIKFSKSKKNQHYINLTTKTCSCNRNISTEKSANREFIKIRTQNESRNRILLLLMTTLTV